MTMKARGKRRPVRPAQIARAIDEGRESLDLYLDEILPALEKAQGMAQEYRVPVVVEVILERVTNVSMGTSIANVTEFEELAEHGEHAPTSLFANLD